MLTLKKKLSDEEERIMVDRKLYDDLSSKYRTYTNQALGMASRGVLGTAKKEVTKNG